MTNLLDDIGRRGWYWLALLALGVSMEAVALIYQYAWDYYPCVLCIHVRIWTAALMLVALLALPVRKIRSLRLVAHLLTLVIMIGLLERSWMLLATERGWVEGSCDFDLGLPAWFALDSWFPTVFKVWEACGYTPELLFGITMAEGLLLMSAALVVWTLTLCGATLIHHSND